MTYGILPGRGPEIIPGINLPSTNTRFIPASYQAKISIQPNTEDQTGMFKHWYQSNTSNKKKELHHPYSFTKDLYLKTTIWQNLFSCNWNASAAPRVNYFSFKRKIIVFMGSSLMRFVQFAVTVLKCCQNKPRCAKCDQSWVMPKLRALLSKNLPKYCRQIISSFIFHLLKWPLPIFIHK
jgi:hypothetical protein